MAIASLGGALALLLATLWLLERNSGTAPVALETIGRIVIEPSGGRPLVLEAGSTRAGVPPIGAATPEATGRQNSGRGVLAPGAGVADETRRWRLTAPWSLAANAARIRPLLELLHSADQGYALSDVDLGEAGLAEPEFVVYFDDMRLLVGGPDYTGQRRYVMHQERVYLVDDWLYALLDGGVSAFASLEVFEHPPRSIRRLADDRSIAVSAVAGLSARQIVAWPRPLPDPVRRARVFEIRTVGDAYRIELTETPHYSALHRPGTEHAWIVDTGETAAWLAP